MSSQLDIYNETHFQRIPARQQIKESGIDKTNWLNLAVQLSTIVYYCVQLSTIECATDPKSQLSRALTGESKDGCVSYDCV